ncbi:uncharacterized protein [Diabrotica undecimpunctata]|uniref:uncharacterized protein n=1 Tax=Diabrotica undecimpunctata TaxID=50387 RepID=UPI003B6351F0
MKIKYHEFMQEYIQLGHMSKVEDKTDFNSETPNYYLPHHGVLKETSLTTKLRVVFDGSARTDSGLSLNDVLMVGPKLQDDLMCILLRFRKHNVVIASDIEKMYRQVFVCKTQQKLQQILWRFSDEQPIETYKLKTLTYGTAPAAFLAIRSLQQLAHENQLNLPLASQVILKDFYVDDLLTGGSSIEEVKSLKDELNNILCTAGFSLRKWVSNKPEIFDEDIQIKGDIEHYLADDVTTKTLGLYWNSKIDSLQYKINFSNYTKVSKRTVLSLVSQIFDPLGLVGPVIIKAKLIMQSLWQLKLNWDESLPLDLHTAWNQFRESIADLEKTHISRQVLCSNPINRQLHCFSDASESAYGAALYIRSLDQGGSCLVHLLCAKSRVAPLKTISLPRLELCGALLAAKLASAVIATIGVGFDEVHFWSDSMITLHWILGEPSQWKTFVGNRVSEIQRLSNGYSWHHVDSHDNPADIITRGYEPKLLNTSKLWWNGPPWLASHKLSWPTKALSNSHISIIPDQKVIQTFISTVQFAEIWNRFSSLAKLQRVFPYILRFVTNCKSSNNKTTGPFTVDEKERSFFCLVYMAQNEVFHQEIQTIKKSKPIHKSSKILSLNPFLDDTGLLRVGGRLQKSELSFDQKHPIILPNGHVLTKLIVISYHHKYLHAGPQALLSIIRLKFWLLSGRNTVRHILHKCVTCFRVKPTLLVPLMGDLPKSRLLPTRPFYNCGVDYGGPFELKTSYLRNCKVVKCYICIFTCFTTRATHIELVYDLSTNSFLNSFKRFIARRGLCKNMYSDNGTNFVGANNHLQELYSFMNDATVKSNFLDYFSEHKIHWHFIPAHSPHFGGIWESTVKSVKFHIRRVMCNNKFTYDEMYTLLTQIESLLNSRPLLPLSESPEDLGVLTPGHFLIGAPLVALPQEELTEINPNKLKRYHHLTQIIQSFWVRWSREYLSSLQQRTKWRTAADNVKIGSLVIIQEDGLPPTKWELGRILQLHAGTDNVVRVVTVRTSKGEFKRPCVKLAVLPMDEQ